MTNSYDQLRSLRNQMLPERMALVFGCEVIVNQDKCIDYPCDRATVFESDRERYLQVSFGYDIGNTNIYRTDVSQILGQPLDITDILRMLNLQDPRYENITVKGDTLTITMPDGGQETFNVDVGDGRYDSGVNYTFIGMKINLALPLSAPENEDACRAIYELLTKNK